MTTANFDHISTSQARTIRDSAERVAIKMLREKGESAPEVAAAWMTFRAYDLLIKSRELTGSR